MPSATATSGATSISPSKAGATDGSFSAVLSNAKHTLSTKTLSDSGRNANPEVSPRPNSKIFPSREHSNSEPEDGANGTELRSAENNPSGDSSAASAMDLAATSATRISYLLPNAPVLSGNLMQQTISTLDSSSPQSVKSNVELGKSDLGKAISTNAEDRSEAAQSRFPSPEGSSALYIAIPQQPDQAHAILPGAYQGSGVKLPVTHSSKIESTLNRITASAPPEASPLAASTERIHKSATAPKEIDSSTSNGGDDSTLTTPPSVSIAPTSISTDFTPQENAPRIPSPSVNGDNGQQAGQPIQKGNSNASLSGTADTSNATASDKADAPATTGGTAITAPSQTISTASQTIPHGQANTNLSQSDPVAQKAPNGDAVNGQPILMRPAAHDTDSPQKPAAPANPIALHNDHDGSPAEVKEAGAMTGVNTAKLVQTMNETEMHVGMHSNEFGDISIRASISQQQMTAQISLDHGDLRDAIMAHVSTMQTKLGNDYGMQASIAVHQQGASSSGGSGQSSQQEHGGSNRSVRPANPARVAEPEMNIRLAPIIGVVDGSRLDIQA